ncbi:hypothetical protein PF005_g12195 [Phytophthora fragariae]|uniref:RxLR effector protein n=1 Tax=Phytophthora fragariae TaxID=53985 RepID=A0A6A3XUH4_9STRA|nr:hypothetical protein PF003_g12376 [Phytophthora fragariae]KAE8904595.1 hypothetical protein PF003_g11503 [Phytophthora fragariae]KAE8935823.1 hypothetical protein PF009_g14244 [Phytophthora fragariae]KAE9005461.1 hypothetical protein PF011_g12029 [Phytophthora fragariae]KAE9106984.1 hypothetical protein PF010_g12435 [Phytophthora fragariae]
MRCVCCVLTLCVCCACRASSTRQDCEASPVYREMGGTPQVMKISLSTKLL